MDSQLFAIGDGDQTQAAAFAASRIAPTHLEYLEYLGVAFIGETELPCEFVQLPVEK